MSTSKDLLKQKIAESLGIIVDQTTSINGYTGTIPQIELDIVKANIRELYEDYHKLSQLNDGYLPGNKEEKPVQAIKPEPVVVEKAPEKEIPVEVIIVSEEVIVKEEIIIEEVVVEKPVKEEPVRKKPVKIHFVPPVIDDEVFEKKPVEEKPFSPPKPKPVVSREATVDLFGSPIVADKLKDDKQSLNEKFHLEKEDKSLASKLLLTPVKDLKAAIGINDKFKFMNELFEGSMNDYNQAIETLNNFSSSDEAMDCLDSLCLSYKWKTDSASYLELKNLVTRRYLTSA